MRVQPVERTNQSQLQRLINLHLAAVIPGWALFETALARHLARIDQTSNQVIRIETTRGRARTA
jgi:hypothetical protein